MPARKGCSGFLGEGGRGGQQRKRTHALGPAGGQFDRNHGAQRVAHQAGLLNLQGFQQSDQVAGVFAEGVGARGLLGTAMAARRS